MIVDGEKYEPVNKDGNSTFEIPVTVFDAEMEVTADTVAMSTPHEIEYTLNFDSSSMKKEEKMKKIISYIFLTLTLILGCAFAVQAAETEHKPADIPGLTFDHSMELSYAKEFNVDYYNDGYALLTIDQEGQFLVVPEGKKAPEGLDPDIAVLQQPINNIYLVATSAMDLFRAIDGIDSIKLPEPRKTDGISRKQRTPWNRKR